jgi:hypothetical protein
MICIQTMLNLGEPMRLVEVVPEEPNQRHYSLVHGSSQWCVALINLCSPLAASFCPCLAGIKEAVRSGTLDRVAGRREIEKQLRLATKAAFVLFIQLCGLDASESVQATLGSDC